MNHAEIDRLITRHRDLSICRTDIEAALRILKDAFLNGGMLLACGAGATASFAEHITTTLMTGLARPRPVPDSMRRELSEAFGDEEGGRLADGLQAALPAIALGSNASLVSAIADEIDPGLALAQQVYGYGRLGDVLLVQCPSRATLGVLNALKVARATGIATVCLAPREAPELAELSDCVIRVPRVTPTETTELHLPVWNALCVTLEQEFFI